MVRASEKPKKNGRLSPVRLTEVSDEAMSAAGEGAGVDEDEYYEPYNAPLSPEPVPAPALNNQEADEDMEHPGTGAILDFQDEQDPEPPVAEQDEILQSGLSNRELKQTRREQDEAGLSVSHAQAVEGEKEEHSSQEATAARQRSPPHRDGSPATGTDEERPSSPPATAIRSPVFGAARKGSSLQTATKARKGGRRPFSPTPDKEEEEDLSVLHGIPLSGGAARKSGGRGRPMDAEVESDEEDSVSAYRSAAPELESRHSSAIVPSRPMAAMKGGRPIPDVASAPKVEVAAESSSDDNVVSTSFSKSAPSTSRLRPKPTVQAKPSSRASQDRPLSSKELRARSRSTRSASAKEASPPKRSAPEAAAEPSSRSRKKSKKSRTSYGATKPGTAQLYTSSEEEDVTVQKSSTLKASTPSTPPVEEGVEAQMAVEEPLQSSEVHDAAQRGRNEGSSPPANGLENDSMQVDAPVDLDEDAPPPRVPKDERIKEAQPSPDRSMSVRVDAESSPELPEPPSSVQKKPASARKAGSLTAALSKDSSDDEDEEAALAEIAAAIAHRSARPVSHVQVSATYTVSYDIEVTEMWSDDELETGDDFLDGVKQLFEGYIEEEPEDERPRLSRVRSPAPRPSRKGKERAVEPAEAGVHEANVLMGEPMPSATPASPQDRVTASSSKRAEAEPTATIQESVTSSPRRSSAREVTPQRFDTNGAAASPPRSTRSTTSQRKSPRKSTSPNKDSASSSTLPSTVLEDVLALAQPLLASAKSASPPTEMTSDDEVASQVLSARKPVSSSAALSAAAPIASPSTSKAAHKKRPSTSRVYVDVPRSPYLSSKPRSSARPAASPPLAASASTVAVEDAAPDSQAAAAGAESIVEPAVSADMAAAESEERQDERMETAKVDETAAELHVAADLVDPVPEEDAPDVADEIEREAAADAIIEEVAAATAGQDDMDVDPVGIPAKEAGSDTMEIDEVVREETTLAVQTSTSEEEPGLAEASRLSVSIEEQTEVHITASTSGTPAKDTVPSSEQAIDTEKIAEPITRAAAAAAEAGGQATDDDLLPDNAAVEAALAEQEGEADAEVEADIEGAAEDLIDAVADVQEQADADADIEAEDEAPEIESSLPGPARDNMAGGVENVTAPDSKSGPAVNGVVESSEEESSLSSSEGEEDNSASASGSNIEGDAADADADEEEPPFSQHKLIAWAEDLKGKLVVNSLEPVHRLTLYA